MSAALTTLLGLEHSPIAVTFLEEMPIDDVPRFAEPMTEPTEDGRSGRVAAPCVFWMHAHTRTFDTMAADHGNCSVGAFTHGFVDAADILDKSDVGALLDVGWVTMEAFAGVASLSRRSKGVRYGPLADARAEPDVVILRVSPRQMMEINDAVGGRVVGQTAVSDPPPSRRHGSDRSVDGLRPVTGPDGDGRRRTHCGGTRASSRRVDRRPQGRVSCRRTGGGLRRGRSGPIRLIRAWAGARERPPLWPNPQAVPLQGAT